MVQRHPKPFSPMVDLNIIPPPSAVTTTSDESDLIGRRLAEARESVLAAAGRHVTRYRDRALRTLVVDYPMRPAKALRPALMFATAAAFGASKDRVLPSALAIELFHNAFLLHDDVEDASLHRRNQATLHAVHGAPIAINVGDALFALALEPLLDNTEVLGLGKALRVLSKFVDMCRITVEGQSAELAWIQQSRWDLSRGDYLRMVLRKTAWYTFVTPIVVGALVADAPDGALRALARGAARVGIGFQIADDLLSIRGRPEVVGKDALGDLHEGKRTLVLLTALERATADDRARAIELLGKDRMSSSARRFVEEHGLPAAAVADLCSLLGERSARTEAEVAWLHDLVTRTDACEVAEKAARRWVERGLRDLRPVLGEESEGAAFVMRVATFALERSR